MSNRLDRQPAATRDAVSKTIVVFASVHGHAQATVLLAPPRQTGERPAHPART